MSNIDKIREVIIESITQRKEVEVSYNDEFVELIPAALGKDKVSGITKLIAYTGAGDERVYDLPDIQFAEFGKEIAQIPSQYNKGKFDDLEIECSL